MSSRSERNVVSLSSAAFIFAGLIPLANTFSEAADVPKTTQHIEIVPLTTAYCEASSNPDGSVIKAVVLRKRDDDLMYRFISPTGNLSDALSFPPNKGRAGIMRVTESAVFHYQNVGIFTVTESGCEIEMDGKVKMFRFQPPNSTNSSNFIFS
ncbi:MAG TPA: hypothetical protein PLE43_08900 [Alphaproteobacteria bacterium]|nr:hypothetical protein [Alphaproteobacteria bacterium]HRK98576.1 hypothetical protein [Alphaproteobacteria bacterium]